MHRDAALQFWWQPLLLGVPLLTVAPFLYHLDFHGSHASAWAAVAVGGALSALGVLGIALAALRNARVDGQPAVPQQPTFQVTSVQQMGGGQTAGIIANFGPQRRTFQQVQLASLVERLSPFAGTEVSMFCMMGNSESLQFADELLLALERAGWTIKASGQAVVGPVSGVVTYPANDQALTELIACLSDMRFEVVAQNDPIMEPVPGRQILVGTAP